MLKMKTTDLPLLIELEATNGHLEYLEIRPSKDGFGAFINKVSKPIRMLIGKKK